MSGGKFGHIKNCHLLEVMGERIRHGHVEVVKVFSKVVVAISTLPFPGFWGLYKIYKMSVPNRFEAIEDQVDNLCFLCLKACSDFCEKCGLAYCCLSHYNVHAKNDYCYPFKVLQKPGVRLHSLYDLRLIAKFILASVIFKRNNEIFITIICKLYFILLPFWIERQLNADFKTIVFFLTFWYP